MKYLRILICLLLCTMLSVNICAETSSAYIFEYKDENITVSIEASLNEQKCKSISNRIVYGINDDEISTISFCWLFGHDLTTSAVKVITHKVKPVSPRCLQETHIVTACSKCDYMEDKIVSSVYISCHPEE